MLPQSKIAAVKIKNMLYLPSIQILLFYAIEGKRAPFNRIKRLAAIIFIDKRKGVCLTSRIFTGFTAADLVSAIEFAGV